MTDSSKIPEQTRNKSNKNRRNDEMRGTTVQWPADIRVLREALREMKEECEKIELASMAWEKDHVFRSNTRFTTWTISIGRNQKPTLPSPGTK
ncbi:hypothetical protein BOTCAL_0534g00010 [Botryotinia calthae]|uniref:Uncharacterized protein n=1 Tax=Botryotinia calthae TaxID=38488 RepID=A0A4Y8CMQ3_9HELO|nr:hypothetical protein BOTCAL_0534g00010 [Botryotinia calthae]